MKILYYNWVQFDNKYNIGGGVNVYQKNLIEYITQNSSTEVYFLSSGLKYNPFKSFPYIQKTRNIYGDKCKSFEIINSAIMAPAFAMFMLPTKFINDTSTIQLFEEFIKQYGPFDVIHFNNIEGISINVLKLKEKYPNTKFIVSAHNYQTICPLVQYFQNDKQQICNDYNNGKACLSCAITLPNNKEYFKRCRNYCLENIPSKYKYLKLPIKLIYKILKYTASPFPCNKKNMKAEMYSEYRIHNVELLNKYADNILAVSERVKQILVSNGIQENKVKTSYIGTKFANNELRKSVCKYTNIFTIAYIGYERIDKGFFFLINSLSKLDKDISKKINIVLAVSDIHKKNYKEQLKNFNKVIVYNGYTHKRLPEILANVNLGIVPVLWEDNLPQVAIEMVALGVPILCSSYGGASELCTSNIFKFEGGNQADFNNKILNLINNPALLQEYWINHNGLTTMEKHIKELEYIYQT